MILLRQMAIFGAIGIAATLAHVAVASLAFEVLNCGPVVANLAGSCVAFPVSLLGNARVTFCTDRSIWSCARCYLAVALVSLTMSSVILTLVERNGLPTYVYAFIVLISVPPVTFLLAKFWAFAPAWPSLPPGEGGARCK